MSNVIKGQDGNDPNNATSPNTFGQSVESIAQREDQEKYAAGAVRDGELLNVYKLVPVAAPYDPNWGNSPFAGEVIVAARTAGDARLVAATRELGFSDVDAAPAEGVSTKNGSAFANEKLYTVVEIEHGRADLSRGVLSGVIGVDTIKPTQI